MSGQHVKNFDDWHPQKKDINDNGITPYFSEREIWFCKMGCNVGYEQDGKGEDYSRPVLILKKYNQHLFTGIPLTTKIKPFPFYFGLGMVDDKAAMAILSQLRVFSSKRLINKIETLNETLFEATKKAAVEYIFGDLSR